jgi:hypothetical protein
MREDIKKRVDGKSLSMTLKVENVVVPSAGRARLHVDWNDAVPFLIQESDKRRIYGSGLAFIELRMTGDDAASIDAGEFVELQGALKLVDRKSPLSLLAPSRLRLQQLRIRDARMHGDLGFLYLTDYKVTVRKSGKQYQS